MSEISLSVRATARLKYYISVHLRLMERCLGVDLSRQDEFTCHFIQRLSFLLYDYKSSHIMQFKDNASLNA